MDWPKSLHGKVRPPYGPRWREAGGMTRIDDRHLGRPRAPGARCPRGADRNRPGTQVVGMGRQPAAFAVYCPPIRGLGPPTPASVAVCVAFERGSRTLRRVRGGL